MFIGNKNKFELPADELRLAFACFIFLNSYISD